MNYFINCVVNLGCLLGVLAFTAYALYMPSGSPEDRASVVLFAMCLPAGAALANYFLMQEVI